MTTTAPAAHNTLIKLLTYTMFMMFAMTTDSVGVIIPEVIRTFNLSMTAGGAFHYANMPSPLRPSAWAFWRTSWAARRPSCWA
jgi:fucose permease